tara:strand:- start:1470 stop:3290 length:1821 start_codon:yes stop_codon:yes gene_type:complete
MASIYPNIFPYNEESPEMGKLGIQTEYAVYQKIKNIYDDSVDILYGKDFLIRNAYGELKTGELSDFLIIHPNKGILFLECKGGLMEWNKMEQVWTQNNKKIQKSKGPFEQAKNGMYSFINLFTEKFKEKRFIKRLNKEVEVVQKWIKDIPMITGAIFPNTPKHKGSLPADVKSEMIIWAEDFRNLESSIDKIFALNEKEHIIKDENKKKILKTLVGDNLKSPFKDVLKSGSHSQDLQFNRVQQQFISSWFDNTRVIIKGLAGTGKTLIAAKTALRKEYKDKKILILTKTVGISKFLQVLTRKKINNSNIMIINVDKFINVIRRKLDLKQDMMPEGWELKRNLFDHKNPQTCIEIFNKYPDERFDVVIVDEAQDFHKNWFKAIKSIARDFGNIVFFYDPLQTTRPNTMVDILKNPNKIGFSGFNFNANYRNTSSISNLLSKLIKKFLPQENLDYSEHSKENIGRPAKFIEANSFEKIIKQTIIRVEELIKNDGFKPMNIGVLYLNSMDGRKNNSKLSMTTELKKLGVKVIGAREYEIPYLNESESNNISFSDVNSFKGLEKEAVILCNFKEINESTVKEIYTGLSRAMGDLTVITYKEAINQIRNLI